MHHSYEEAREHEEEVRDVAEGHLHGGGQGPHARVRGEVQHELDELQVAHEVRQDAEGHERLGLGVDVLLDLEVALDDVVELLHAQDAFPRVVEEAVQEVVVLLFVVVLYNYVITLYVYIYIYIYILFYLNMYLYVW